MLAVIGMFDICNLFYARSFTLRLSIFKNESQECPYHHHPELDNQKIPNKIIMGLLGDEIIGLVLSAVLPFLIISYRVDYSLRFYQGFVHYHGDVACSAITCPEKKEEYLRRLRRKYFIFTVMLTDVGFVYCISDLTDERYNPICTAIITLSFAYSIPISAWYLWNCKKWGSELDFGDADSEKV
ncbi:LAMI_0F12288g1_1 [Lachancea mirantina]|uniref:LAMI_0F12288g1_1 n=1 Tax=Lachancea mirantina TaxID=1230905 RepID=A0A1G4K2U5_9SACH|nr:LAMI_0F12288g1_1 [Lachancea mirantina]